MRGLFADVSIDSSVQFIGAFRSAYSISQPGLPMLLLLLLLLARTEEADEKSHRENRLLLKKEAPQPLRLLLSSSVSDKYGEDEETHVRLSARGVGGADKSRGKVLGGSSG